MGTQKGTIRTYKYPINGDFHDYKCQSGPITRLALASDSSVLVAASQDGSLFVLDIREIDLASKLRKEQVPTSLSILSLTKSCSLRFRGLKRCW